MNLPVYIFNTETPFPSIPFFEEYYLLPAGFYDSSVLPSNNVTVTYYDFNQAALNFKKLLIEQWNCSKDQLWEIIEDLKINCVYSNSGTKNFEDMTQREKFDANWYKLCKTKDVFESFFKVKSNTVKFIKYDIVKNPSLDDLIQNNTKTKYMWFSNCFKYEYGEDTDIQTCAYTQFIKTANDYNLFIDGKDVMLNNVHGIPKSG